jgi:small-conductance mechanosensitive channel
MRKVATLLAAAACVGAPAAARAQDVEGAAKVFEFFRFSGVLPALLIIGVAIFLLRTIGALTGRLGKRFADRRLLFQQISTVLRFAIYIITAVLLIRSLFKLDDKAILALSGAIAVSVGFALKDLAASVLAGITILFDRPFQVGDRVTFGSHYGEITVIGLRSVKLVTLDDSVVTIPNNKFLTDVVVSGNAGALDMQIVIDFFVAQDSDISRAKRIVYEALRTSRFVYLEKPVVVLVNDLIQQGYITTRLRAKAYVLDVRYEKAFETDVTERVKRGFTVAKIQQPRLVYTSAAPAGAEAGPPPVVPRSEQPA